MIRDGRPVLVDLNNMDGHDAKRIVDFMAGAAFVSYGSIERVSTRIFLVSPRRDNSSVGQSGDDSMGD